jgi:hypothetical protein
MASFIFGRNICLPGRVFLNSMVIESLQLMANPPEVQMRNQAVLDKKSESHRPSKAGSQCANQLRFCFVGDKAATGSES